MYGKRLAEERRRLGRSQDDFARSIGLGRSGYAAIEGDRAALDVERLMTLGKAEGVDFMFVMTGERSSVAAAQLVDWSLVEVILTGSRCVFSCKHQYSTSRKGGHTSVTHKKASCAYFVHRVRHYRSPKLLKVNIGKLKDVKRLTLVCVS